MSLNKVKVNNNHIADVPAIEYSSSSDLDVRDSSNNVLARFKNGHIQTKNFNSENLSKDSLFAGDLYFEDEERNTLVEFKDGHVRTKNFDSSKTLNTVDTIEGLEFQDDNDNILARIHGGHIKTKYFDSADVIQRIVALENGSQSTSRFKGKRLAIIAVSISTFRGTMPSGYADYYPTGDVQSVQDLWWYKVCQKLEMNYTNCAWSGSRVTGAPKGATAAAGCSDIRINDAGRDGNPDIIICYISCNDWAGNVSVGTWKTSDPIVDDSSFSPSDTVPTLREAYSLMVYKLFKKYLAARVFCCTNLDDTARDGESVWPSDNGNGVSTYEWNKSIIECAEALGARIIDLHACGMNYMNIRQYCVDSGLHPNKAGQQIMADFITAQLIANY